MPLVELIVIACMLMINAVFAAYELALASVNPERLRELAEHKRRGAAAALKMKDRMEASLAVVQVGITLVAAIAAAVGGASADENLAPWLELKLGVSTAMAEFFAIALIVLPLAAVTILVGELVPKAFALKHADWVCLRLSPAMRFFALSVYPVVLMFEWVTKQFVRLVERNVEREALPPSMAGLKELQAQARLLRYQRIISPQQERVILGAGRLTNLTVGDIAVPPSDFGVLYADGPLTEHIEIVHLEAHTRFLVTEKRGDPQTVVGYVNVKDLFFLAKTHPENPTLRQITRPMMALASKLPIGDAFARMMSEHVHLALVRDDDGRVHGMITLEDILEEVVGDIQDEFDRLPRQLTKAGQQWVAGGGAAMSKVRQALNLPIVQDLGGDVSLNDWITNRLGRVPRAGEAFDLDGMHLLIRKVRRQKIMEVLISAG